MLRTAGTEQVIFATLERLVDYTTPFLARKASFTESALTHIIEGKDCLETLDNLLSKRSLLNTTSNHETKRRTDEIAAATPSLELGAQRGCPAADVTVQG